MSELRSRLSELQLCDLDRAEIGNGTMLNLKMNQNIKLSLTYSISTPCAALVSQATLVYCWRRLKGDSFIVYKYLKREEVSGC